VGLVGRALRIAGVAIAVCACAASAQAQGPAAPMSLWDVHYVLDSGEGAHFEVDLGRSLQRHGHSATTRRLGARMVADHSRELAALRVLADSLGLKLPQHPSIKQRHEISGVLAHHGAALDRAYVRLEISDHYGDIRVNDAAATEGINPDVKAFTERWLPMYRTHLGLFEDAADTLHVSW
jgi:putative membrane protein